MNIKREYKKVFVLSLLSILMISMFASFVMAADTTNFVEGIKGFFGPISNALFGSDSATGSAGKGMVFEAFLFALMILAIVYATLDRIPLMQDNAFALWVVSIACAVLGTRFMLQNNWLAVVMIPQGVLGISLIVLIPFLVFFWFVEFSLVGIRYRTIRKICWAVYAVVWGFLWFDQSDKIAGNADWLYPVSVIVAVAMLFLDGTMQKLLNKMKSDRLKQSSNNEMILVYRKKLADIKQIFDGNPSGYTKLYASGTHPPGILSYHADVKFLQSEINSIP